MSLIQRASEVKDRLGLIVYPPPAVAELAALRQVLEQQRIRAWYRDAAQRERGRLDVTAG